ncbi:DNA gyrase subunit A [Candidatus Peregrinibacteria bacterium]|nr:DNA gyrase subunit A [Candidatus Peregrinibacteria bacterium]
MPKKDKESLENEVPKKKTTSNENNKNTENTNDPPKLDLRVHAGIIKPKNISAEMEECYLDYAMSVIVSRALPDVRDGLKPVHRRILHTMNEMGLRPNAKYRKSAAIVGDVLGKYHPHGDAAVYESMVRMAQDFALRYMLVNGQGNFGSIDGDSAAAMRYTEVKMQKMAEEMLADLDKETVDWQDNYDGTRKEPKVLPTKIPQLLLNGTMGIAVGMATNIPPHNLGEIIDGLNLLIENPEATIDDLMQHVKGPDFPTSGIIYDIEAIKAMYVNGRGGIVIRAKAEMIEKKGGKAQIIVTEIPYQVNKSILITKIADLISEKKIVGIQDIRDESNREGIRIVIDLKKDSFPKKVLNQLYKFSQLQSTFNMNMIALVDGIQPRLLNLKQVLEYFIIHRQEVVTKRTLFELKVARDRAHILEGLKIALDHIDAVIETIRKSETKEEAHANLMKKFKLSDKQTTAILEMRLQTLAGLERKKIIDEYNQILELIKYLEDLLKSPKKILGIIKKELQEIREKYADERRTKIIPHAIGEIASKDYIPNEEMIVMLTKENYIKRIAPASFRSQKRGGKGVVGATTKDEDEIRMMTHVKNHDELLFFTNLGRVYRLPVYEIPQTLRTAKGQAIVNLLQIGKDERVTAMLVARDGKLEGKFLFMATHTGTVKKTAVKEFINVRKSGLIAIKLRPEDSLEWVKEVSPDNQIMMVTKQGKCIRFNEKEARPLSRPSMGVRGIRLKSGDEVKEMDAISDLSDSKLFVLMENGLGKYSLVTNYRLQARGGSGVKTAKITQKTGQIIAAKIITTNTKGDLLIISKKGQVIRMALESIPTQGRATQGVYMMRMKGDDKVASVSTLPKEIEEPDAEKSEAQTAQPTLV